jgi:hypothetical protein
MEYNGTFVEAVIAAGWYAPIQATSMMVAATAEVASAATITCRAVQPAHADRQVATVA